MDNFKAVYLILSQLEKDMDRENVNLNRIDANALCVSERRWQAYIEMLADAGYIKGVRMIKDLISEERRCSCDDMRITLKGLEYLQENSIMQRFYKAAKGIRELIPV